MPKTGCLRATGCTAVLHPRLPDEVGVLLGPVTASQLAVFPGGVVRAQGQDKTISECLGRVR